MAREHRLPPSAACLSASMRDLGYSLETAVADLIDNSISAGATEIQVLCDVLDSEPWVAVYDNGKGMDEVEVLQAMKHGSINPKNVRNRNDLGRFGLGLKTASFSQCKKLTLISSKAGTISAAEWDLDIVDEKDDWLISILSDPEIQTLPLPLELEPSGTVVLWRNLDRLFEEESGAKRADIVNEKIEVLHKHLSLVFHRYLAGEIPGRKRLSILVNGHEIKSFDPFCRKNKATQVLPEEVVWVDGTQVTMQPYILPHHSKLSAIEYDHYQDRSDFLSNQGAYIYRNGRLMAWGDWFRLVPKGEATKLARVQIDFPNNLDESWTIDIKKSRARPPHQVRERLRQIISHITGRSTTVHRGRGKRLFQEVKAPLWERYADKGTIRYSLNHAHPLIEALAHGLDGEKRNGIDILLEAIASSLPTEMIYSDFSTNPKGLKQNGIANEEIFEKLKGFRYLVFPKGGFNPDRFRETVMATRMFGGHEDKIEEFIEGEME